MNLAALDPWIRLAEAWQYMLAGLFALLASVILALSIAKASKTRAAASGDYAPPASPQAFDRPELQASLPGDPFNRIGADTEELRSLLRRAVSSLSYGSTGTETARTVCKHIAALGSEFRPLPGNADPRTREVHAALIKQFKLLQEVLEQEWSPPEALAVLIQMNTDARALSAILEQRQSGSMQKPRHRKS